MWCLDPGQFALQLHGQNLTRILKFHPNMIVYQEHDGEACPEEQRKEYDDAWALIVKAHETLTDETSWRNWLETGNPDGRLQTTWGIALPGKFPNSIRHLIGHSKVKLLIG